MFMSLYTNKTKSILTEQRFLKLISILEQKQEAHRKRFQNLILLGKNQESGRAKCQEIKIVYHFVGKISI